MLGIALLFPLSLLPTESLARSIASAKVVCAYSDIVLLIVAGKMIVVSHNPVRPSEIYWRETYTLHVAHIPIYKGSIYPARSTMSDRVDTVKPDTAISMSSCITSTDLPLLSLFVAPFVAKRVIVTSVVLIQKYVTWSSLGTALLAEYPSPARIQHPIAQSPLATSLGRWEPCKQAPCVHPTPTVLPTNV